MQEKEGAGSTKTCISREEVRKNVGSINTCCAVICCSCHNPVMQGLRTESMRASMQVYMQEARFMAFFGACCNEEFDGKKEGSSDGETLTRMFVICGCI